MFLSRLRVKVLSAFIAPINREMEDALTTLTVIGEPLPGFEAAAHAAAARDLATALADIAPRGCNAHILLPSGTALPETHYGALHSEHLTQRPHALTYLWRTPGTARPVTGELVHTMTPLAPLNSRASHSDAQISVMVPHALAWVAPETLETSELRNMRTFTKRAIKYAHAVLAPTHAVATALTTTFGHDFPIQVLPLAAPREYGKPADAEQAGNRRTDLQLPVNYLTTTATLSESGRLEWLFEALRQDETLPLLVVLATTDIDVPADLTKRVRVLEPETIADVGVVISGSTLFVCPQRVAGTGYELLGALDAGVPVLHSDCEVATEVVLDAGRTATTSAEFSHELSQLMGDPSELARLGILAADRSRAFSWNNTAWQLWELHANL